MFKNEAAVRDSEKLTKSERTRDFILQQALVLFQNDGYESVTMRDLAQACDSSLGSFYYHFKNKEEIILELFRTSLRAHIERTHRYLDSHQTKLGSTMTWICRDRFAYQSWNRSPIAYWLVRFGCSIF